MTYKVITGLCPLSSSILGHTSSCLLWFYATRLTNFLDVTSLSPPGSPSAWGPLSYTQPTAGFLLCFSAWPLSVTFSGSWLRILSSGMFLITSPCFHVPSESYTKCNCTSIAFIFWLSNSTVSIIREETMSAYWPLLFLSLGPAPRGWSRNVGWMSQSPVSFIHPGYALISLFLWFIWWLPDSITWIPPPPPTGMPFLNSPRCPKDTYLKLSQKAISSKRCS